MKKYILLSVFTMAMSTAVLAQFKRGSILAGGSISSDFNKAKYKYNGTTTTVSNAVDVNFMPDVGFFVADNFAIGAGVTLYSSTTKDAGGSTIKDTDTGVAFSPFVRYYMYKGLYFNGSYSFGSTKQTESYLGQDYTNKGTQNGYSLGFGYAILLNEHIAIEPGLSWNSVTSKQNGSDTKQTEAGLFLQVGFQIYLHK